MKHKPVIAVAWRHGRRVTSLTNNRRQTIKFPTEKQAKHYINTRFPGIGVDADMRVIVGTKP
jgi:hypothetical protein